MLWLSVSCSHLSFRRRTPTRSHLTADGFPLGVWVSNMRQMKKDGRLSSERIAVLTEAGIVWEPHSVAWEAGFARFLMLPPDANGSRYVPISFVTDDGFALGKWQENQRQTYKSGKLAEARRTRLANAGIVWEVGSKKGRGPAAPAGNRDLCNDHSRRRLTLHRALSSRATDAEAEWHEEWRQRLGCWWLALPGPTQAGFGNCIGAFLLHLAPRLDTLLGRSRPRTASMQTSAEHGCEWLDGASEEMRLPDLPSLGDFDFTLPPIPRLLPPSMQLHAHSHIGAQQALRDAGGIQSTSAFHSRSAAGLGFGTVTAASVLAVALVCSVRNVGQRRVC